MGQGELIPQVIAPLGQPVHGSAARIADAEHPRHLVKTLAGGIVPGGTHDLHLCIGPHIHDGCGAAGYTQADEGGLQVRVGDIIGRDVAPDMVDRDEGQVQSHGCPFGEVDPYQHSADEAGGIGDRYGV